MLPLAKQGLLRNGELDVMAVGSLERPNRKGRPPKGVVARGNNGKPYYCPLGIKQGVAHSYDLKNRHYIPNDIPRVYLAR